jgi:hypothetical protein
MFAQNGWVSHGPDYQQVDSYSILIESCYGVEGDTVAFQPIDPPDYREDGLVIIDSDFLPDAFLVIARQVLHGSIINNRVYELELLLSIGCAGNE